MSLYNILFGFSPLSPILLQMLGILKDQIPRYRDCFLNRDGTKIIIHTRTGGGNREAYQEENAALMTIPGYISDVDDTFDSTYANFYYEVPEAHRSVIPELLELVGENNPPEERWKELFKKMQGNL